MSIPAMDLTPVLNGPPTATSRLKVQDADGKERDVTLRPITYTAARPLLYEKWLHDNRKMVEQAVERQARLSAHQRHGHAELPQVRGGAV